MRTNHEMKTIITLYGDKVFKLALSLVKDYQTAEDISQNVFVKYMLEDKEFEDGEHTKAWLLRVTINECKMHFRYYWNAKRVEFPKDFEPFVWEKESEENLLLEVMKLPRKYREVLHLHYYEDLSIREISALLKKKEATVKTNLHRGRQMLKKVLEESGYER